MVRRGKYLDILKRIACWDVFCLRTALEALLSSHANCIYELLHETMPKYTCHQRMSSMLLWTLETLMYTWDFMDRNMKADVES